MLPDLDRDLLATYLRPHRPRLALLAALFVAGIVLQLANPQLAKTFIDAASAGHSFDRLLRVAAGFLGVALLTQLATIAETFVAEDLGWRTTNALRADLTRHVLQLDDSFHARHGAGELLERIDGDVSAIAGFFSRFVVHVLGSALLLIGVLVVLWLEDWRIGALLTTFSAAAVAYLAKGGGFVGRRSLVARRVDGDLSAFLEERLGGLVDIKSNGADDATMRRLHEHLAKRFDAGRDAILAASLFSNAINVLLVAATAAALVTAASLHRSGSMTVGGVFLVFRYTTMLRMPLERLARHMNSFQHATAGIVRVRDLLATTSRTAEAEGSSVVLPRGALAVELDSVWFAYGDEHVLRNVSFHLEPEEVLGVLGRTGSGKTTVARLVARLHDVGAGAVRVGGHDVRAIPSADLRQRVAVVTQDVQLFAGSLRDNVRLFDEAVDDARLLGVFTDLALDEWLRDVGGLDATIGTRGRGLSAGEAQLVALARVFLRDPGVVVLDEASSRLDPRTEELLENAMSRLLSGRTGIVIAHRLRTVERATSIVILEDGEVVERGRRADLANDEASRFAALRRAGMAEVLA